VGGANEASDDEDGAGASGAVNGSAPGEDGKADDGDGIDFNSGGGTPSGQGASDESCGNGIDDDQDGEIDEDCSCDAGDTQSCYGGEPSHAGVGACSLGTQLCVESDEGGEFLSAHWDECVGWGPPSEEVCDGIDNDCDGAIDEALVRSCNTSCGPDTQTCTAGSWSSCDPVVVDHDVNINGDCVWAKCPAATPYPIGCNINFVGGDPRGCVGYVPGDDEVYFQEGDVCNAGYLTGKLVCSSCPGGGLNASNCPINKPDPRYVQDYHSCPGTQP
jgi:hypothetical protein